MIKLLHVAIFIFFYSQIGIAQNTVPLDAEHWDVKAKSFKFENYKGQEAVFIEQGIATLKDNTFMNGTIEFDIYLPNKQSFPGVRFRILDDNNMESFYLRPHLPGKPDANQVVPVINGISPWQMYFGPAYSFPYEYKYDDWTHVKLVINGDKGQIYLDHAERPNLSFNLVHEAIEGGIGIGGSFAPAYYSNFKIDKNEMELKDFNVITRTPIEDIIPVWEISDVFQETALDDLSNLDQVIESRTWGKKIRVEENVAANISRQAIRAPKTTGNTVFTKVHIESEKDQLKLFEFGYSDRVVVILNGEPIYKGNNKWRSRDYRYLGTIGLFDAVYLNLKKGNNELLLAVSEDFGGWLVTGRIKDKSGILIE
jgi:hypothetical protein